MQHGIVSLPLRLLAGLAVAGAGVAGARAEFGDVIINNYSDEAGMRPVVFPHWFHRIRFRCNVCHAELGFALEAGANDINMLRIIDGEYCGACHDGRLAWSIENCELCHSGTPGTPSGVHRTGKVPPAVPAPAVAGPTGTAAAAARAAEEAR